jgi:hypothetical protein
MKRQTTAVFAAVLSALLMAACTSSSPAAPGPTAKTTASLVIVSLSVTSEASPAGRRVYRVTAKLHETAGAPATITAADLTFVSGSLSTIVTMHADNPASDAGNVCPAGGMVDTRQLTVTDDDVSHPAATSVQAKITFNDGSSTSSVTASADVPQAAAPAPAATLAISGLVSDDIGSRAAIGTVEIVDGINVGKSATTASNGTYSIAGLAAGTFTVRATAGGYDSGERSVTLSNSMTLDWRLKPIASAPNPTPAPMPTPAPTPTPTPTPGPAPSPAACSYTIAPTSATTTWQGGTFTATITRASGSCSWAAVSDSGWITFTGGSSGSGTAVLTYFVAVNGGVVASNPRQGNITVSWTGGSARLSIAQGPSSPELCVFTITLGGQDHITVPSAGGQFSASVAWVNTGIPPFACSAVGFADGTLINLVPPGSAPTFPASGGALTFTVPANPSPGTPRSGSVWVRTSDSHVATLVVTQQ